MVYMHFYIFCKHHSQEKLLIGRIFTAIILACMLDTIQLLLITEYRRAKTFIDEQALLFS